MTPEIAVAVFIFIFIFAFCPFYHFLFYNVTATTEIYTLSLHDALPISVESHLDKPADRRIPQIVVHAALHDDLRDASIDRKSTRLNSSHVSISYAVFCLKKKNKKDILT